MKEIIEKIRNKVIVSVQAQDNEPLNKPEHLLAISQSAIDGGAGGLRLCGIQNIKHIIKSISCPIIGLTKLEPTPINWLDKVYITATMGDIDDLLKTNSDFIAIDGTSRPRADNSTLKDQIDLIKQNGKIVICDVATYEDGVNSFELGADIISTTLSGYTKQTRYKANEGPDFELLDRLLEESPVPVILEGRIWELQDVRKAFDFGAHAVIIGSAITRPYLITRRFVSAIPQE